MGVLVPRIMEAPVDVVLSTPQERVQNRTPEQTANSPVHQFMGADVEIVPFVPQNARAESYAGADCGFFCASVHGGSCGGFAFSSTGARAKIVYMSSLRIPLCLRSWRQLVEVLPSTPQEFEWLVQFLDQVIDVPVCARQFWCREANCGGSAVAVLRQGTLPSCCSLDF